MAKIINVSISIDSDNILQNFGKNTDPNNPKFLGNDASKYIFMITEQDNVVTGQAGHELKIKGVPGDVIRWRETTLSMDANTDVLLYRFVTTQGTGLFSTPVPRQVDTIIALPEENNPLKPITEQITTYYWTSDLQHVGDVTYHFCFMILNAAGQIQGYYSWDPYIHIAFSAQINEPIKI